MPCSDAGQLEYEYGEQKKRLNRLTRLLCETCTYLGAEDSRHDFTPSDDLLDWWAEHQKQDKIRLKQEERCRLAGISPKP